MDPMQQHDVDLEPEERIGDFTSRAPVEKQCGAQKLGTLAEPEHGHRCERIKAHHRNHECDCGERWPRYEAGTFGARS